MIKLISRRLSGATSGRLVTNINAMVESYGDQIALWDNTGSYTFKASGFLNYGFLQWGASNSTAL